MIFRLSHAAYTIIAVMAYLFAISFPASFYGNPVFRNCWTMASYPAEMSSITSKYFILLNLYFFA
jgi:hypothetical protein